MGRCFKGERVFNWAPKSMGREGEHTRKKCLSRNWREWKISESQALSRRKKQLSKTHARCAKLKCSVTPSSYHHDMFKALSNPCHFRLNYGHSWDQRWSIATGRLRNIEVEFKFSWKYNITPTFSFTAAPKWPFELDVKASYWKTAGWKLEPWTLQYVAQQSFKLLHLPSPFLEYDASCKYSGAFQSYEMYCYSSHILIMHSIWTNRNVPRWHFAGDPSSN